ncbi:hypothetical protein GLOTRDRAFT_139086 [Gloeophyllum trabeum ATCC 11539]|uniref:Uncharacterized protein n=1 Tax=Gloeophyllum trabeum (strain ATCC 11539 / FP-39264 / Madison 617) TaxID=670483 RepID=S7RP10_GLOTA|nr:uncharacterized protein GLOTRDRAFT_139086 [Gloeophyllum trabeum ATCC 11539]EPQ54509.1 hypothetical protein GLOTRDRAFT_139086 [Gloeophyllum trabeum ATCC 11539]
MSLNYKTKNEDGVLSRLFMSDHASACNVWQLGVLVAKVLLAMLEEDDSDTSTLEVEIETCIMVLLSIALQPHVANGVITRVINHPPTGIDELDHLVDRAQKVLIAKMRPPTPSSRTSSPASRPKAISSAPPSPYLERSQFITEKATRPRGMSRSSTWSAPTTNTAGSMMSKSAAASAVVTSEELTPSGSFVPTRSAFCSLRSMTSDSPRRRGRLPFKWFQRSSSPSPQRSSSVETRASSVPSFSRTSSPDSLSTTATSVAPDSPVPVMLNVPQAEKQRKRRDSVLKEVEDTSPLNTSCCCARKHGVLETVG